MSTARVGRMAVVAGVMRMRVGASCVFGRSGLGGSRCVRFFHDRAEAFDEAFGAVAFGVRTQASRVKAGWVEGADRVGERVGGRGVEEGARFVLDDRFERDRKSTRLNSSHAN